MRSAARRAGFSLIEALIALAIASMGLLAIYAMQHQLVEGQRHYEAALRRAESEQNILSLLRDLNPMRQPSGSVDLPPNKQLQWTSRPISGSRRTTGLPAGDGSFQVQVYAVTARIVDASGRNLEQVSFDRLGWVRVAAAAAQAAPQPAASASAATP